MEASSTVKVLCTPAAIITAMMYEHCANVKQKFIEADTLYNSKVHEVKMSQRIS